ncbi:MAG: TAT-variant-translocated molybdopterin oxidoreductase [Candidatus Zixiibacteriota bacterium]
MRKLPAELQGKEYWRSFEQLADSPEFKKYVEAEFPDLLPEMNSALSRRKFLSIMGASLALAGLAGCRRPVEKIVPYVVQPEEVIPGIAEHFATSMPWGLSSHGLVVESHEGRPTKIEGNKLHSSSLGGSNVFLQAEILNLYDPDRSQYIMNKGAQSDWDKFVEFWREKLAVYDANRGEGLAVITEPFASPTMARLKNEFTKRFPRATFVAYEPVSDENIIAGIRQAVGGDRNYFPVYHYDKADVVLALESDFLNMETENIAAAKGFASRREMENGDASNLNRLYVVESDFTSTGASAEHRYKMPRRIVSAFVIALANELRTQGVKLGVADNLATSPIQFDQKWLKVVASDLIANKGKSIVVGGRVLPAEAHELITRINHALGNLGTTVELYELDEALAPKREAFKTLVDEMVAGNITTLFLFGTNPAYTASGLNFARAMRKVETAIHVSTHVDETTQHADWHINRAHFLESWGDTRAVNGHYATIQPLIAPLFNGKSDCEVLNFIATGNDDRGYDIVRATWQKKTSGDFEKEWRRALHDGVYENKNVKSFAPRNLTKGGDFNWLHGYANRKSDMELTINLSPTLYDGRYANNAWMQELPHPMSKLTWDNAAIVSNKTAERLHVKNGDVVSIKVKNGEAQLPVWIIPGMADDVISLTLGYGRTHAGRVGNKVGVDLYPLINDGSVPYFVNFEITKTGRTYNLVSTQDHGSMAGRPIIRETDVAGFAAHPEFAKEAVDHPPLRGIYPEHDYSQGYQWGMTIDLNKCIGCNACTIACTSENNIPVVGKEQVGNGREMHWIRLDRYYVGDTDNPDARFQPVNCQHCENAPCEEVCPVQATSHDREGLNVMTYNRCVGTRYCSNNCPYKVRRFNYFNFTKDTPEIVKMAMNPDVTVRSRGVMEKCTYCTQRINRAKQTARLEGRTVRDGEFQVACQQACPADAIVFGNINENESRVIKAKAREVNYELLGEFNTKPRTSFLAIVRNPHPELKEYSPKNG